jgi:hypothetical protein
MPGFDDDGFEDFFAPADGLLTVEVVVGVVEPALRRAWEWLWLWECEGVGLNWLMLNWPAPGMFWLGSSI